MEKLKYTIKHNGKMKGMMSLSTSTMDNPLCIKNRNIKGSICESCFAYKQTKCYKSMDGAFKHNASILTTRDLKDEEIEILNVKFFRFEAFGDLHNEQQLKNYIKICNKNKHVDFAIWSKNYKLILEYFKNHKKPKNLRIIISSLMKNIKISTKPFEEIGLKVSTFTVYTKDFVKEFDIDINCGARNCLSCQKCYRRETQQLDIRELIK